MVLSKKSCFKQKKTFNRTTVECKSELQAHYIDKIYTFNRTTVECKWTMFSAPPRTASTFNRTTVECKWCITEMLQHAYLTF